ncbi:tripartite tricarboxylate transporter TctB family protein [Bradyrhizobium sp.]|uniref:tripartite tricarboxylate transporter TctB family protein n=1 Tax=Bradyrhizobium sp. TaxID=376 RepID=UPI002B894CEA|nr:tripartite tricarboxylate transporter TctB family protein [Bradyrhizobium sp.]HMM91987.1 tripartite tricarboxylate transporter TctB family protein [Bradyrhizobium sp.]
MTPERSFPLAPARRITALIALLLAGLYVSNAWQTLSFGRWHKPGAAIFPVALGLLLALSALTILFERRGDGSLPATFSLPAGADLHRLLLLLGAFAFYFLAMPVIGNMVASALFLFASMRLLSDDPARSLVRIAIYATVIAVGFELFFVRLLQVQMPGGLFRQWLF